MKYDVQGANAVTNNKNVSLDFKIGNAAVIIDILRNRLYSDKIRVVAQEYLCNARDAMREAGNTKNRIEVTLPTEKSPTLKIRDYGPGLSAERVADVFVALGNSTKRSDDGQTGGFGIGGKSAFAYTDSFTVISVHNGIETHYVAHVGKNSIGSCDIVHTAKSTARPGVEIQIGVKKNDDDGTTDVERFVSMVYRTICFWKPEEMPKIINDYDANTRDVWFQLYERVQSGEGFNTDKIMIMPTSSQGYHVNREMFLVIDGIVYDLDDNHESKQYETLKYAINNGDAYLLFPANVLEISASREAISVTKENRAVLNQAMGEAYKSLVSKTKEIIEAPQTIDDAKDAFALLSPISENTRQGTRKIEGINVNFANGSLKESSIVGMSTGRRRRRNRSNDTPVFLSSYFIHNDDDLAESTLETKIRELAKTRTGSQFAIIAKDRADFAEILGATAVSTLKAVRTYEEKERIPEGKVNLRVFNSYGERTEYVHVDTTDTGGVTYVLVENTETRDDMMKFKPLQTLFDEYSKAEIKFAFPSKATMKAIAGKANFVKQADFFANTVKFLGQTEFDKTVTQLKQLHALHLKKQFETLYELATTGKKIDDEKFVKHAKVLSAVKLTKDKADNNEDEQIKTVIEDAHVKTLFAKAVGEVADMPEFIAYVNATYPLLKDLYVYSRADKSEIVHYLNGKYASLKAA